ncbi:putative general secretion pathway protein K [Methylocella silvestris BL2]|uniref:Putative general secretion pathway protein K n=1 Tax=Methylocella silvestris (strain DSM 15510 / CIP 108128 / LMG 27833 / NCIMB 13906 / BL2) TaxID=395965 RepID=B8ELS2_METSB|nr:type II secretion system protein GspK [Methylocella silvestris]ACK50703.1 putative general secretion pathway protein K [Methylocella silvestris BL2]
MWALKADGFIVVAALWMLAALAALAGVYAAFVSNTAASARLFDDRLQAEALINAGLELAALRVLGGKDDDRPSSGEIAFRLGRATVDVTFRSEAARIDLNEASKPLLSGMFVALGAKQDAADFAADRIIGWRKKSSVPGRNEEADRYRDAGLGYAPRQAPFQNLAELRFVLGLPADLVERALSFVTIFNGHAEVDVNEAAPEVIASLPHISPDAVAAILRARDPQNPSAVVNLLGAARSEVSIGGRRPIRVAVAVRLDSGRKVKADVVLLITDGAAPYRILAWRDDFDGFR